jgi:xanthosine phosphorylase
MTDNAKEAAKVIRARAPGFEPKLGIVLGSGLGELADVIENPIVISYEDLPGFPPCSVEGHGSHLYLGTIDGLPVACLKGRVHFYEGMGNDVAKTMTLAL